MPGPVFRRGEAVELRTVEEEDADFLAGLVNDPRVRAGTAMTTPISEADEREWIESTADDGGVHLLACVDGDPVGIAGLNAPDEAFGSVELGYQFAPDSWGNGYATDAARELCGHAFETRRLHKVYANVYETNPASARVLEKVGFTEEGRHREEAFVDGEYVDIRRFGLLEDERSSDAGGPTQST
ncbi:GNAT family N-acetyltransferase [Halobaculum halobium]|uniref:GNAT family N-acetyltransferase n=1 Tax=Halobaculum halobium TaxID=3032281 RepID=A0ABD5TEN2_9EURY|nr:GNAT family protein [Halobaculum sp. SYNS20]